MHFWKTLGKIKCVFLKAMFLGQEVHYYMVYIAYCTESKLQFCNYAKKMTQLSQKEQIRAGNFFCGLFALAECVL